MPIRRLFWQFLVLIVMSLLVIAGCAILPQTDDGGRTQLITVEVIVTATPDPDVSPEVIIITATLDRTQVAVPAGIVPETTSISGTRQFGITQIPDGDIAESSSTSDVPAGCLLHIVDDGDTIFGLADEYGVNPFIMLEVNGLTEDTAFLDIGDELIVPIEGCPIEDIVPATAEPVETEVEETSEVEVTAEVTAEETEPANLTPSPTPTVTLAPTAVDSEIQIVEVIRAGDVTAEGVRIRNNGRLVEAAGWTISDADGNEFEFEGLLLFSNAEHTIYTRSGEKGPIASYWGLEESVWQPGDVVTLRDADGDVQAVLRITADG